LRRCFWTKWGYSEGRDCEGGWRLGLESWWYYYFITIPGFLKQLLCQSIQNNRL